jgi:hypothetical protein
LNSVPGRRRERPPEAGGLMTPMNLEGRVAAVTGAAIVAIRMRLLGL